jgi:hypothetical protein
MRRLGWLCVFAMACGGSTQVLPTPYQPYKQRQTAEHPAGGYFEEELQPGLFLVTFRGSIATPDDDVVAYTYKRAAELCGGTGRFDVLKDEDLSRARTEIELSGGGFGWAPGTAETTETVWPRHRLTVRCH